MKFNEKLQKLRKEKGMSQEALADELGVSRQAVSKWENGKKLPTLSHLVFLAELYECSLDELVMSFRRSREHQGHDQPDRINIRRMYKKVCSSFFFCKPQVYRRERTLRIQCSHEQGGV